MTDYRTQTSRNEVTHVEHAACEPLTIVDLNAVAAEVKQDYKNFVVLGVNTHCVRMAVMEGEFRWHRHPHSDECFIVLEGHLEIDLAGGRTVHLDRGQAFSIPAGIVHRTRARTRTVNLCFEHRDAYTDVIFSPAPQ